MTVILDKRLWTGSWDPSPPVYNTADVNGVSVTGLVVDDGELFIGSRQDETGVFRLGYDEGSLDVKLKDMGDALRWEFWYYGDETETHRVTIHAYDIDSNKIYRVESDTCGWSGGCETYVDFSYDFSGNTNEIWAGSWADKNSELGNKVQLGGDKLLLAFGITSAPDNWPEAVENSREVSSTVTTSINSSYCQGDTVSAEIELQNQKLIGDISGSATVTNNISGNTKSLNYTIPEGGTTTINPEVTIPDDSLGSNIDIISVDLS